MPTNRALAGAFLHRTKVKVQHCEFPDRTVKPYALGHGNPKVGS